MTTITRTEDAEYITYTAIIDGVDASELLITKAHRVVANVETRNGYERQGLARALWEHANAEAECLHAQPHHRTEDGDAFAQAVGGCEADDTTDHVDVCDICTGEYDAYYAA